MVFSTAFLAVLLSILITATPISYAESITVNAVVLPNIYIITSPKMVISEIISNTSLDVTPKVYVNSTNGQQVPLTASLYNRYLELTANKNLIKPGVVYPSSSNKPKSSTFVRFMALTELDLVNLSRSFTF